jgi:hypothetical protein
VPPGEPADPAATPSSRDGVTGSRADAVSAATLGARGQRCEHVREVAADLGTDLRADGLGGWPRDLHSISDARALVADGLDEVCRADDEIASVRIVDEQLGFRGFGDAQLDRLLARRRVKIVLPTANGPRSSIRSTPAPVSWPQENLATATTPNSSYAPS